MSEKKPYIIDTSDGSHSIFIPAMNETYHSSHGAITESLHVFIRAGVDEYRKLQTPGHIKIFEVGFGTGLNALLTLQWAEKTGVKIHYESIEQFPLQEDIREKLNYGRLLEDEHMYSLLNSAAWDEEVRLTENFTIRKINSSWQNYILPENYYQVIYYDAFAPGKQPEMWTPDLLRKCFDALTTNGLLVTYCASGRFKRDLISCGFEVETLPGPPGKKEMVRGRKVTCG